MILNNTKRVAILLGVVSLFLVLPFWLPTTAQQWQAQTTVLGDYSGLLTQEAAIAAAPSRWRPLERGVASYLATGDREIWLRTDIPPGSIGGPESITAEIAFPYLKHIDFIVLRAGQVAERAVSGMEEPEAADHLLATLHTFTFSHAPASGEVLLIRVHSSVFVLAPLVLARTDQFVRSANFRAVAYGLYAGAILLMIGNFLFVYLLLRDDLYLAYSICLLAMLTVSSEYSNISLVKYLHLAHPFQISCRITLAMITLVILSACFAVTKLLALRLNFRIAQLASRLIIGYSIAAVILIATTPLYWSMFVVLFGTVVAIAVSIPLGVAVAELDTVFLPLIGLIGVAIAPSLGALYPFDIMSFMPWLAAGSPEYLDYIGKAWCGIFLSLSLAVRLQSMEKQKNAVIDALGSNAPADKLNKILGTTYIRQLTTGRMTLSVVFIDIVGFSRIFDLVSSDQAFQLLTERLNMINQIVREHDGAVDRSLGDGILCFFGYNDSRKWTNHAAAAFAAARKIQETIVSEAVRRESQREWAFPVRIGINTAEVTVGNLGGREHVDFSIIGGGVNFASRLETACSPFKIILSEASHRDLVGTLPKTEAFHPILISVKHQSSLVKAYEFDPFLGRPHLVRLAETRYLDFLGMRPIEPRFTIKGDPQIFLAADVGRFRVVDYSRRGFSALGDVFIGQNATLSVSLEVNSPEATAALRDKMLHQVLVEIRTSRRVDGGFLHGMRTVGLNAEQRDYIYRVIAQVLGGLQADGEDRRKRA